LQKAELIILFSFECGFYITFGTLFTSLHTKTKEIMLSLEFNVTWVSKKTFKKQCPNADGKTSSRNSYQILNVSYMYMYSGLTGEIKDLSRQPNLF